MMPLRLTFEEIQSITGGLTLPRCQLRDLHANGFWRARLGRDGKVVLEREHYQAVCAGALPGGGVKVDTSRPQLRAIKAA